MFCWKRIREEGNGRCPACRELYPEEPEFREPDDNVPNSSAYYDGYDDYSGHGPDLGGGAGNLSYPPMSTVVSGKRSSSAGTGSGRVDRSRLRGVRVLQRNLVYLVGIPSSLAKDSVRSYSMTSSSFFLRQRTLSLYLHLSGVLSHACRNAIKSGTCRTRQTCKLLGLCLICSQTAGSSASRVLWAVRHY